MGRTRRSAGSSGAAETTGMEASLFVASGTMGNLASRPAHATGGGEVILGDESHIFHYENGSASAFGGSCYTRSRRVPTARCRSTHSRRPSAARAPLPLLPLRPDGRDLPREHYYRWRIAWCRPSSSPTWPAIAGATAWRCTWMGRASSTRPPAAR